MEKSKLEAYWEQIPVGKHNAVTYSELVQNWGKSERQVRAILHELSLMDNGDDYILVRSASGKGFYRTDDAATIRAYKKECLNKGKSVFAPVKKINRVLNADAEQITFINNLRAIREERKFKQSDVYEFLRRYDSSIDRPLISKFENGVCLPTPFQLSKLSVLFGCEPAELVYISIYTQTE